MNVSDMITELQDHGFEDVSTTRVVAHINDAYHDVCSRIDWTWLRSIQSANSVASTATLTLGTAWKKIHKVVCSTTDQNIPYIEYSDLIDLIPDPQDTSTALGEPKYFYIFDDVVYLYPIPDSVRTYKVWTTLSSVDLLSTSVTADIAIPAQHQRVLILGALKNLYPLNDDINAASYFEQQFEKRVAWMIQDAFDRQGDSEKFIVNTYED